MSDPFVGEIRMFAGTFAPRGWALCDGQLLAIAQNDALFSLFGTIYGGDGRTTFGLPDLRGRIPIHAGTGPGLTQRRIGQKSGAETHTLTAAQMASHRHQSASSDHADLGTPVGNVVGFSSAVPIYGDTGAPGMNAAAHVNVGGSQSHTNLMPFQCVNFIVALFGVYPSRN